jgi:NitT/TauT family transport system substrate-binding protein
MKRWVCMFVLTTLFLTGVAQARTYKIGMVPWIGWSPNNVADVKGFWKAQGLDVQVINYANPTETHTALINQRVDLINVMMGSVVGFYMKDSPCVMVAELDWSTGGDKLVVKKGLDPQALKGQPFGVYTSEPSILFFLNQYLAEHQVKLSDVNLVEMDVEDLAVNFIAGRLQAISNYDPYALRAAQEGNGETVATAGTYPGSIPEGYAARADVLQTIPREDLVKLLKGWVQAVQWINDDANWVEYAQILNTKTFEGMGPFSDADLRAMRGNDASIHNVHTLIARNQAGGGLLTYLQELKAMLQENNLLTKDFAPADLFDPSAIMEALQGAE